MAVRKLVSVGPVGEASASGTIGAASLVGECDALVGLLGPEGCTGKDKEKRFVRAGTPVSVAADIVLLWLWKLARSVEPAECIELVGLVTCSIGLGFAAIAPLLLSIFCTSIGCTLLLRFDADDIVRCGAGRLSMFIIITVMLEIR